MYLCGVSRLDTHLFISVLWYLEIYIPSPSYLDFLVVYLKCGLHVLILNE